MELRISTHKRSMSPVYERNPGGKEISDDDRNHKHCKTEDASSQLFESDVTEHLFSRADKPFQNGLFYRETRSKYTFNSLEREFRVKFDQKRPGWYSDLNQKIRVNQPFSGDPGAVMARFNSVDIVQQGSIPHSLFRGLPTVSNSHGSSRGPFGLDMIHSQGTFRPVLMQQHCRDFEEQGFCLRGDMCPMEHGVNRIVVEDVQSLSQFNLPITAAGRGPLTATSAVTNTLSNRKSSHGADFYDPDQPLWGNKPQPNFDSFLNFGLSGDNEIANKKSSIHGRITSVKKRREIMISKTSPKNSIHNSDSSLKRQKAQRTLFVNGIPRENNRKESLLSHFKKFGEIIDICIPVNSGRAFVQFSKSEEAEAALMAPDAVMGNRFIKLWWANRDKIQHMSVANKRKNDSGLILHNDISAPVSASDHSETVVVMQKKLESLEVMKEELRKKQEMLDQKRNDFRCKLDKLAKQARGIKGEVGSDGDTSTEDDMAGASSKYVGPSPSGPLAFNKRFKLDNRPTAFKIVPPLPDGLAHVLVLKGHFSAYGDVSKVQLGPTAQIYFTTRHAAEKAFLSGKSWKGHNLQFVWLTNSTNSTKTDENP